MSIGFRARTPPTRSSRWGRTDGREARTTRATSSAARAPREAGFALYELILALAIIGLVAGVVFPRVARPPGPAELGAKAQQIAAVLRSDRNAALRSGRDIVARVDMAAGEVVSGVTGEAVTIPPGVAIEFVQSSRERRPAGGGIRFRADGGSSGGVLTLRREASAFEVSVSWLTGGVLVAAAAPDAEPHR